ncbi:MAG: hypothetical protein Q8N55_00040, partial [bacterium]|nr:hypothetical protein [bacterium]
MSDIRSIGVLSREVNVQVKRIENLEKNPFLSPEGVLALTEVNEFARDFFGKRRGVTTEGYLVRLSEEKRKLPHPCQSLSLDVSECVGGLRELKKLFGKILLKKTFIPLHLHRSDGSLVEVAIDRLG